MIAIGFQPRPNLPKVAAIGLPLTPVPGWIVAIYHEEDVVLIDSCKNPPSERFRLRTQHRTPGQRGQEL